MSAVSAPYSRHGEESGRLPKSPKPRNPKPQIPRRRVPTCSRSGRRWRNCSIPRSIAAKAAWVRAPACSRRRIIPGTAAPAAKPPRIGRGNRRRKAMMWRSGTLLSPSPPRGASERSSLWGRGGGSTGTHLWLPPPRPPPARGRGEKRASSTNPASAKPRNANSRRRITAPRRPSRRSTRNWQATRLHHGGRRRRRDGAAAAQQDGGARRRRDRGCAGRADPRRPPRIQGRRRPDQNLDAASPAAPGKIRRRRAALSSNPNTSRRATSRPRSRIWSKASAVTTAPRCCSASPARARPTPWPR